MSAGLPISEQTHLGSYQYAQGPSSFPFDMAAPEIDPSLFYLPGSIAPPLAIPPALPLPQYGMPLYPFFTQPGLQPVQFLQGWPVAMGGHPLGNIPTQAWQVQDIALEPSRHPSVSLDSIIPPTKRKQEDVDNASDAPGKKRKVLKDRSANLTARPRKKRVLPDGEEWACRICMLFGNKRWRLSRKDSLKRHIEGKHKEFKSLSDSDMLNRPRKMGQSEDLTPLIMECAILQQNARLGGAEIRPEEDILLLHPQVFETQNSQPSSSSYQL